MSGLKTGNYPNLYNNLTGELVGYVSPEGKEFFYKDALKVISDGGYVCVGDSTLGLNNAASGTCTVAITVGSTTATVTRASHGSLVGQPVNIDSFPLPEVNGYYPIASFISTSQFTVELSKPASATLSDTNTVVTIINRILDQCPIAIANAKAGRPLYYLGNFAIGGSKSINVTEQMQRAFNKSNNPYSIKPSVVFMSSGINSVSADLSSSQIITELLDAKSLALQEGVLLVMFSMMPVTNSYANWSVVRMQEARKVNKYFRDLSMIDKSFIFIDCQNIGMDLSNQYGNWKTGYSTDGIHPIKLASQDFATFLKTQFFDVVTVLKDSRKLTSVFGDNTLSGTAGTASGAGVTGNIATGFTLAGAGTGQAIVASKGISRSGAGESQVIALTAATALDNADFYIDKLTAVTVGKWYVFRATITATGSGDIRDLAINIQSILTATGTFWMMEGTTTKTENNTTFYLETPPIKMETGATRFRCKIFFRALAAGSMTIQVDDVDLLEITPS